MDKKELDMPLSKEVAKEAAKQQVEERSFAMDLLTEFKQSNKRMFIIIIILIAMLVGTNMAWLWTFTQYDFETYEISTDGGGDANYIGNDGDINNGKDKSEESN